MPRISKKSKTIEDLIQDYLDFCSYKNLSKKQSNHIARH
ncbi:radical SAM protein [uncultured Clostridium sp.]